jgi:hypothetical protein
MAWDERGRALCRDRFLLRMQKIFQRFLGRFELAPKNYAHHIGHAIDAAASPSSPLN